MENSDNEMMMVFKHMTHKDVLLEEGGDWYELSWVYTSLDFFETGELVYFNVRQVPNHCDIKPMK